MKTTRTIVLLAIALFVGFLVVRWCEAQAATNTSAERSAITKDVAFQELESLENHLHDTHQTNALKQLNDFLSADRALDRAADMSRTVGVLQGMRNGQNVEVLQFLENHLDMNISVFASEYRTLPAAIQKQMSLKSLYAAQSYRTKFPFKSSAEYAEDVTNAFKILNNNAAK